MVQGFWATPQLRRVRIIQVPWARPSLFGGKGGSRRLRLFPGSRTKFFLVDERNPAVFPLRLQLEVQGRLSALLCVPPVASPARNVLVGGTELFLSQHRFYGVEDRMPAAVDVGRSLVLPTRMRID